MIKEVEILINDNTFIIPESFILSKAPGSRISADALSHKKIWNGKTYVNSPIRYYRDPDSFKLIYNYICGYEIDFEGQAQSDLVNLSQDCDYYGLPVLKAKLEKHLTINPEFESCDVTKIIKSYMPTIKVLAEMILERYPEFSIQVKTILAVLNDQEAMNAVERIWYAKPRYERKNQGDTFGYLIKYLTRFGLIGFMNAILDFLRQQEDDMSTMTADILEKTFPEYFYQAEEKNTSFMSSLFSGLSGFTGLSGLFGGNAQLKPEAKPEKNSTNDLLNSLTELISKPIPPSTPRTCQVFGKLEPVPAPKKETDYFSEDFRKKTMDKILNCPPPSNPVDIKEFVGDMIGKDNPLIDVVANNPDVKSSFEKYNQCFMKSETKPETKPETKSLNILDEMIANLLNYSGPMELKNVIGSMLGIKDSKTIDEISNNPRVQESFQKYKDQIEKFRFVDKTPVKSDKPNLSLNVEEDKKDNPLEYTFDQFYVFNLNNPEEKNQMNQLFNSLEKLGMTNMPTLRKLISQTEDFIKSDKSSSKATTSKATTSKATSTKEESTKEEPTKEEPTKEESTTSEDSTTKEESTTSEEPTKEESTTSEEPTKEESTTSEEPTKEESTTSEEPTTSEKPTKVESTTPEEPTKIESTPSKEPTKEEESTPEKEIKKESVTDLLENVELTASFMEKAVSEASEASVSDKSPDSDEEELPELTDTEFEKVSIPPSPTSDYDEVTHSDIEKST